MSKLGAGFHKTSIHKKIWPLSTARVNFVHSVQSFRTQRYFLSVNFYLSPKDLGNYLISPKLSRNLHGPKNGKSTRFKIMVRAIQIQDLFPSRSPAHYETCDITFGSNETTCLDYMDITDSASVIDIQNTFVAGSIVNITVLIESSSSIDEILQDHIVIVKSRLYVTVSPFGRWKDSGVTMAMVDCASNQIIHPVKRVVLEVHDGIGTVRFASNKTHNKAESSLPYRLRAMERGLNDAIAYAKLHMNVSSFPNLRALFNPADDANHANIIESPGKSCNRSFLWPPIFSQNRFTTC